MNFNITSHHITSLVIISGKKTILYKISCLLHQGVFEEHWSSCFTIVHFVLKLCVRNSCLWLAFFFSVLHTCLVAKFYIMPKLSVFDADWGPLVDVAGYCFLNLGSKYLPPEKFVQWIKNGASPVYIGFGSMVWSSGPLFEYCWQIYFHY